MTTNWNLKALYESFECEAYQEELKQLDQLIGAFKSWVEKNTKDYKKVEEKLVEYIQMEEHYAEIISTLYSYASLTISADALNEEAAKYQSILKKKMSEVSGFAAKASIWIGKIPNLAGVIDSSDELKTYSFYLKNIEEAQKYMLSGEEEAILAQMKNNGSSAWEAYKNKMISTHKVAIEKDGVMQELPLTQVLNMAYDTDKAIREKAYYAELASYEKIEEGVAAALNAIKGEVLTVIEKRGYTSPIEMTLVGARMDQETLDAMLDAMRESMPLFRKYLRRKAERLGYTNGLPWFEMYAPIVETDIPFPYEKGKAFVLENFKKFSDELHDFAKEAMDNEWIDVYPKPGKVGGAFCAGVKRLGESRILLNYGDSLSDTVTMAHELGHGYHNLCLKEEKYLNSSYPMPIAETASNFCELLVKKAALKEVDGDEKLMILEAELSDCAQVIVDIYSRYLFETAFFEKRKEGYVSVKEIKELMLAAQKEAYGDGLDENFLHPYMWTWKSHYYYAERNFYNFPYAFGLLFSKGLYAQYEQDKEGFPAKYHELLSVTGKMKIADIVATAGLDVRDIEFWRASLKTIAEDIESFMELTK